LQRGMCPLHFRAIHADGANVLRGGGFEEWVGDVPAGYTGGTGWPLGAPLASPGMAAAGALGPAGGLTRGWGADGGSTIGSTARPAGGSRVGASEGEPCWTWRCGTPG